MNKGTLYIMGGGKFQKFVFPQNADGIVDTLTRDVATGETVLCSYDPHNIMGSKKTEIVQIDAEDWRAAVESAQQEAASK